MGKLKFCVLDSCNTNSCLTKPRDLRLHRFPTNLSVKRKWEYWVRAVGGSNCIDFTATKSTQTLCAKHFKPSDYINTKLSFKAVPTMVPTSQAILETTVDSSQMNMSLPPTSLQTQTNMPTITNITSLNPSMSPQMCTIATGQNSMPGLPASNLVLSPLRLRPNADIKSTSPHYTVAVFQSPVNGHPVQDDEASQQPRKSKHHAPDSNLTDFECPVRAQKSLNLAADEIARTKKKLQTMHLKYLRATRKIKTLTDILKEFKEKRNPSEDNIEIKVCSSCRKINVCQ